ncbi:MAG: Ig-like domain-containing protein [Actinomycetota bacterium]|nr:Ig-like domain-containing protein [Actinomycetota bacterium]
MPADGQVDISPDSAILVSLSYGQLNSVTVTDAAGVAVEGTMAEGADGSSNPRWVPTVPLLYGATYTVTAEATGEDGGKVSATSTFGTVTPAVQVFPAIGPLDGTTVGIGMPIRLFFDAPVLDKASAERNLLVTTSVPVVGGWNWFSDTEVHWRPQVYWPPNIEVRVDANIYGVDLGNGAWGKLDRSIGFTIGPAHISRVDAATHTMQVFDGGALVQTYPISAGMPGFETNNGAYVVIDKNRHKVMDSTTYGLALDAGGYVTAVEYATRISNNGTFVHAAPWSVASQGIANVSHGCINLSNERAAWFFDFSQIGDVVEVVNGVGDLGPSDGDIYDWSIPWETWVQGSALN